VSTALVPVSGMSIDAIESEVCILLRPDAHPDVVADLWQRVEWLLDAAKRVKEVRDACLLDWFPENGGELVIGDTKLYPGRRTSEKVRDLHAALDSALTLSGGDVEVIEGLLSANALKPGACASAFGPEWRAEHFEKRVEPVVEVKKVNTKFLSKKAAA